MNASTAPVCAPVIRPVMKPLRLVVPPPVITRIDRVAARIHSARSTMRAVGHLAAFVQPGHLAHRQLGVARRLGQLIDRPGGGCSRWPRARAGPACAPTVAANSPVDGAADGRACDLVRCSCAAPARPQRRRPARRSRCGPSGPASLEISANVSTRPLASVTMPASELVPVSDPVLARSQPGGGPAGVGVEVAVGQRAAAAGDRQQVQQRPQLGLVGAGGGVDHLVEGLRGQPVVDGQPAGVHQRARRRCRSSAVSSWPSTACDRAVEALRPVHVRRRPRGRSTRPSRCRSRSSSARSRSISGGDCTDGDLPGRRRTPTGSTVTLAGSTLQRDGQRAAGVERGRPGPAPSRR